MTTLELSAVEVANLPTEGTFWLVREGERDAKAEAMNHALAVELFTRPDLRWPESSPPAEFVQACAPCETCGNARRRTVRDLSGVETFGVPCPACRIELVGPCPTCDGGGMIAHCGRTDNGSDGPCVLAPHAENFPCYGDGDVASDWSPVSWCSCGRCSCGSLQAWTEQGPCQYCHEQPTPGTVILGHAYAVGKPLLIVSFGDWLHDETVLPSCLVVADGNVYQRGAGFPVPNLTAALAHYGPPESQVGKFAVQLRRA